MEFNLDTSSVTGGTTSSSSATTGQGIGGVQDGRGFGFGVFYRPSQAPPAGTPVP